MTSRAGRSAAIPTKAFWAGVNVDWWWAWETRMFYFDTIHSWGQSPLGRTPLKSCPANTEIMKL
eukprot:scaffold80390_cov12-Tisochrysis_lutea.AAC.1